MNRESRETSKATQRVQEPPAGDRKTARRLEGDDGALKGWVLRQDTACRSDGEDAKPAIRGAVDNANLEIRRCFASFAGKWHRGREWRKDRKRTGTADSRRRPRKL